MLTAAASIAFTWSRLFVGMDLRDESFYVLEPWRWVLGDRPFVQEQNLFQLPALLEYPFVKLFGLLRGNDPTGLVLYTRHLYLLMMIGVAAAVFLLLRRLVRWQLALVVACISVSYIFWATPQLSYDTMALAFLTLGTVFGAWVVTLDKGRGFAFASGAACGFAVVAYPTLLFVMPFFAVLFAFAHGRRASTVIAQGAFVDPPRPDGPPTGRRAWRSLSAWALGGGVVLLPVGAIVVSFGIGNVRQSWRNTLAVAHVSGQLGGAAKAVELAHAQWALVTMHPLVLMAGLAAYLVYRRWPRAGRVCLLGVPFVLWLAAQSPLLSGAGFPQAYVLLAPYLFLFLPGDKRQVGAKLLIWVWASAIVAGVMTAYTSASANSNAAVGFAPALMVSGLFLAWALEAVAAAGSPKERAFPRIAATWLALAALVAVVGVSVALQFEFQQRGVPYSALTSRFDSGPWWGIKVTPERHAQMDAFAASLRATARPGDKLLVFYETPGYYLYWPGAVASYTTWLWPGPPGRLPPEEIAYFRGKREVPTLVVRALSAGWPTAAEVATGSEGLGYRPVLVRPGFVFYRKPAGETVADVLRRLPRK